MQITITINTDNAAFEGISGPTEARKILERVAERIGESDVLVIDDWKLRDSNGNTVGSVAITEDMPAWIPANSEPEGFARGAVNQGVYKGHRYAWNSPNKGRSAGWSLVE